MTHGHFDMGYSESTFSKYAFGRGSQKRVRCVPSWKWWKFWMTPKTIRQSVLWPITLLLQLSPQPVVAIMTRSPATPRAGRLHHNEKQWRTQHWALVPPHFHLNTRSTKQCHHHHRLYQPLLHGARSTIQYHNHHCLYQPLLHTWLPQGPPHHRPQHHITCLMSCEVLQVIWKQHLRFISCSVLQKFSYCSRLVAWGIRWQQRATRLAMATPLWPSTARQGHAREVGTKVRNQAEDHPGRTHGRSRADDIAPSLYGCQVSPCEVIR